MSRSWESSFGKFLLFFTKEGKKKNTKSEGGWVRVGLGARRQWKMSG